MRPEESHRQIAESGTSQQMLRNVTENFPGLVFWKDRHSVYLGCNRAFAHAAGLRDSSEIAGKTDFDLPWAKHEAEAYLAADQEVMESGKARLGILETQYQAGGRVAWFETTKAPLLDSQGNVIGILGTSHDVTEQKHALDALSEARNDLERRVAERTAKLLHANKELEAFAYAVSHDLRAPLRGVDTWSLALLENSQGRLDPESIHCIESIRVRIHRMRQLIDSMLRLSLIGRFALHREPVDLSVLAREAAQSMEPADRKVELLIEPGLAARGDPALLRAVLQNLLANAWKFTGKTAHPRVEFGAQRGEDGVVFFVRDNGAGFDMAAAGKLFTPFSRLHHASDFPGAGIGLATVERIIRRHGGRIWAESAPNRGAAFYFTLQG